MITELVIRVIDAFSRAYTGLLIWWAPIGDWFYYTFHPERDHD